MSRKQKTFFSLILSGMFAIFLLTGCKTQVSETPGAEESGQDMFNRLLGYIRNQFNAENVPGGSIAVINNNVLSYSAGIGVKRFDSNDQVDPKTLFVTASAGKMLTAAAIMTLVDEGVVDLNAAVTTYVPYFNLIQPFDPSNISVHQLLTHTSGFPGYVEIICNTDEDILSTWFREHTTYPLWGPPGRLFNYSNLGYSLVGLILEEASGIPFIETMKQRIYDPLGMTTARYGEEAIYNYGNYAVGHVFNASGEVEKYILPGNDCPLLRPAGGCRMSSEDMARFVEMLLANGGEILSSDSATRMMSPLENTHNPYEYGYGYGLSSRDYKGLTVVRHSGGGTGFRSEVCLVPEYNFGVVVMVNVDNFNPYSIAKKAMDIFLNLPANVSDPDYSTPPSTWGKYTGTYLDPYTYGEIRIYQDGEDRLWVEYGDKDYTTELFQSGGDMFYFDKDESETSTFWVAATFYFDENEISEYFVTRFGVGKRL